MSDIPEIYQIDERELLKFFKEQEDTDRLTLILSLFHAQREVKRLIKKNQKLELEKFNLEDQTRKLKQGGSVP